MIACVEYRIRPEEKCVKVVDVQVGRPVLWPWLKDIDNYSNVYLIFEDGSEEHFGSAYTESWLMMLIKDAWKKVGEIEKCSIAS